MKNKLYISACLIFLLTAFSPIDKLGGDVKGNPEEIESHISASAKALIEKSFADVTLKNLVDHHVHVVGLDDKQGTTVNPRMMSWWRIIDRAKTSVYLSGSGVNDINQANTQYIERLVSLIKADKYHGKYHILAFDHNYNADGTINKEKSEFYTSNEYVANLAKQYPDIFVPVISVHPYRKDAIEELTKFAKQGARWIKWLPNAQNIDASNPRLDKYYRTMKKYNMVLLTHSGEEQAVHAEEDQRLGNPLLFRRPLDMGVKVVMAHCASLGENEDLDNPGKKASSFNLFLRMMDNPKYEGLLYGEISAMTQFNRLPVPLLTLLERTDTHNRLVNGSDYPLPAINVVIHTRSLVKYGMITKEERKYLNEIYSYNPLLFDYVLKRTIRHPKSGKGFDGVVFEEKLFTKPSIPQKY
jgi:predicted TIM-barrel fold metal-dependent hydrolase